MKLVIAEKPSVGAAIAAVMGANEKRSGYFEGGGGDCRRYGRE